MDHEANDPEIIAGELFSKGYNCSQSIFAAFASQLGISCESALRLSSPFGGGIARQGHVCGALTGALMVLGLKYGTAIPEGKEMIYKIAGEFMRRFKEQQGAVLCSELIGYDISTSTGMQMAREKQLFTTICPNLVRETAKLLAEYSIK